MLGRIMCASVKCAFNAASDRHTVLWLFCNRTYACQILRLLEPELNSE